jgi:hypothetical protein
LGGSNSREWDLNVYHSKKSGGQFLNLGAHAKIPSGVRALPLGMRRQNVVAGLTGFFLSFLLLFTPLTSKTVPDMCAEKFPFWAKQTI